MFFVFNFLINSFVGNYFWTHYFYHVLGAYYTMETYRLNDVPYLMYFATQCYFLFYHSISNMGLRFINHKFRNSDSTRKIVLVVFIAALSYFTAFMETFTIQHFPYYVITDRPRMYLVGSVFYALYFIVSFPMFYRIEEDLHNGGKKYSLSEIAIDAFAASMIVTCLLDFWRLGVGSILPPGTQIPVKDSIPWLSKHQH